MAGRVCKSGLCAEPSACVGPCDEGFESGGDSGAVNDAAGTTTAGGKASNGGGGSSGASGSAGSDGGSGGTGGADGGSGDGGTSSSGTGGAGVGGGAASGSSGTGGAGVGGDAASGSSGMGGAGLGGEAGSSGTGGAGVGGAASGSSGTGGAGVGGAGTGGDTSGGSGGTNFCDPNYVPVIECTADPLGSFPWIPVHAARGLALLGATNEAGSIFELWVAKAGTDTVAVTWTKSGWPDFGCFDTVPEPQRGAAAILRNAATQVFMTGHCGELWQRTILLPPYTMPPQWEPWQRFDLSTAAGFAEDVASSLTQDGTNVLYVVANGAAYATHRVGLDPYADWADWQEIHGHAGSLVTAGTRSAGEQQIFTIDADGHPWTNIQSEEDLDSEFEGWQDFGSESQILPRFIDIEVVYGRIPLEVYALAEGNELWWRKQDDTGVFTPWVKWALGMPDIPLKAISASQLNGSVLNGMTIAGVGEIGIYARTRWDDTWDLSWHKFESGTP